MQVQSPVPETPESLAHTRDTPDPGYMGHPARQGVFGWLKGTCGLCGERQVNGPNHTPPPNIPRIKSSAKSSSRQLSHRPTAGSSPICFSNDFGTSVTLGSTSLTFT